MRRNAFLPSRAFPHSSAGLEAPGYSQAAPTTTIESSSYNATSDTTSRGFRRRLMPCFRQGRAPVHEPQRPPPDHTDDQQRKEQRIDDVRSHEDTVDNGDTRTEHELPCPAPRGGSRIRDHVIRV